MKRIIGIVALVVLITVLGTTLVACAPSKGVDAAKAAWKVVVKYKLEGATNIKLDSVEFKRYNMDDGTYQNKNCYYFKFVCVYYVDNQITRNVWYVSAALDAYGKNYTAYRVLDDGDTYTNLEKKKSIGVTKVNKTGSLSAGQIKKLMAYYEQIKDTIWLPPQEGEEEIVD